MSLQRAILMDTSSCDRNFWLHWFPVTSEDVSTSVGELSDSLRLCTAKVHSVQQRIALGGGASNSPRLWATSQDFLLRYALAVSIQWENLKKERDRISNCHINKLNNEDNRQKQRLHSFSQLETKSRKAACSTSISWALREWSRHWVVVSAAMLLHAQI